MEALGFYVCEADLEDELIRSLGAGAVEQVIESEGEWGSFRTFQKQLEKRGLAYEEQLHGFMWNRKIRYARLLVEALDLARVPARWIASSLTSEATYGRPRAVLAAPSARPGFAARRPPERDGRDGRDMLLEVRPDLYPGTPRPISRSTQPTAF